MKKPFSFTAILGLGFIIFFIIGFIYMASVKQKTDVAAGFAAKQLCTCIYVELKDEGICLKDISRELGPFNENLKVTYFSERVIVDILGKSKASAELDPGHGCSLRNYTGLVPNGVVIPE